MNRIKTLSLLFSSVAVLVAVSACDGKKNDQVANVKETGLPKAQAASATAGKIAYIEVDTLTSQYEFCKEYTLLLTKKSESYKATLNSKTQQLQKAVIEFQQKAQQGGYTQEEGQKAQAKLQKQQEDLQKLQEQLAVKFEQEQEKYNKEMRDSIQSFLRDYNKSKGYSIILSKAGDNMLYADPALDITSDVVNGLNKRFKKK